MLTGFEKIVEERILAAARKGAFDNLPGKGKPLPNDDLDHVPEDLKMAYRILKNADCVPPEIEIKKEICRTEELLAGMKDTEQKYKILKKLNFLIMRLNCIRKGAIAFDMPQEYEAQLVERFGSR